MNNNDTAIIIPVYNEADVLRDVIASVRAKFDVVICVNDGSVDTSSEVIEATEAILIEHPFNLGQGAALQTGIDFALQFTAINYFVTYDADGQHDISDAEKMLDVLKEDEVDIVVGSRFLGEAVNITLLRKIILKLAVRFTNIFSGVNLTDTHNGMRVFNRKFAEYVDINMPGMAHASEIIDKIGKGGWRYAEAPVTIQYNDYSKTKGQSMMNSVNIVMDILLNRTRK